LEGKLQGNHSSLHSGIRRMVDVHIYRTLQGFFNSV
jgi:hypothetical protein